ncbi:MAG TPA: FIST N-terminal domain-containing protein [Geobacteraceae bacterium]|nr:FIST N-terminal domain-containing protein [Geobacteraceae bacterium]
MKVKTAFSVKIDVTTAVADIREQLSGLDPAMVLFFASPAYQPDQVAAAMAGAFPSAVTFGCSTAGEIVTGRMLSQSLVAMAFGSDAVRSVKVEVITDLDRPGYDAFTSFEKHFGTSMAEMDPSRYVGLLLIDGLSRKEELVVDRIGDLTNVNFIGGSAGDDLRFSATHVYANGTSYSGAAIVALLEPAVPFSFVKTQSFAPLPATLTVTRANEAEREVLEFNHKPAAVAYAEALGVPVEEAGSHFLSNPVGLLFEGEPYVRSPQRIKDGSMIFYCAIKEGMELSLLQSTDIIADTARALDNARTEFGEPSALINFNCILRTLELRQKGLVEQYANLFSNVQTIGFSTYGEQFIGHVNQTATILLLY